MKGMKSKALCDVPQRGIFCGPDKYLKCQEVVIDDRMFPVMEDDSYFFLVKEGSGHVTINGVQFEANPGDIGWIQTTHVLTFEPSGEEPLRLWVCVFEYQLSNYLMFRPPTYAGKFSIVYGTPLMRAEDKNAAEIRKLFHKMKRMDKKRDYGTSLIKVSLLGQMAVLFGQEVEERGENCFTDKWPVCYRACMYIAAHSAEPITLESTAEELRVEPSALNRELRRGTGMNFEQMINRNRVILAASYFLYENLPFDYIAVCSGFHSEITFYRNFKKLMGITPQQYRESVLCEGTKNRAYRGMVMDETLVSVINYLYENIAEPVSLDEMAKALYTSGSIIRSLLDKAFGIGYKEILSLFRIRYAEALLATVDLPILDISVTVGFNSARTFSRVFSSINGMTPNEYRQMCHERRQKSGRS